jgi:branched-chain amino acid transport system ATP-binding protein
MTSLLSLANISTFYGPVQALHAASLDVKEKEIVTLIGANGAGKSTLLMTVCGNPQARSGRIAFDGQDITNLPTHEIARLGLAQVPEGRRIFPRMSVRENLTLGGRLVGKAQFKQNLEKILARLPRLAERLDQPGGTLSGGEQQMLAIGRACMGNPRLLLLDEPSLGLAPLLIKQVFALLAEINHEDGVTILLVEQNATAALKLANRGYVLVNGRITLTGTGAELLADPAVRAAYLEGGVGK